MKNNREIPTIAAPSEHVEPTLTQESFKEAVSLIEGISAGGQKLMKESSAVIETASRGGQELLEESNQVIETARRGGRGTQAKRDVVEEAIKETPNGGVARLKKVEERLMQISPQGIIINSREAEEYDELNLELASLKKRLGEGAKVAEKTLPSAYEAALKRISEKEATGTSTTKQEERAHEIIPNESAANEAPEANTETSEMTAEEKEAREAEILTNIKKEILADVEHGVNRRAEKVGATDFVRNVGEKWRTVSLKNKLLISAVLIIGGMGSAAIGATAGVAFFSATGLGMRALGAASMYAGFNKLFDARAIAKKKALLEKNGESFTDKEVELDIYAKDYNKVLAGSLAAVLALAIPGFLSSQIQGVESGLHGMFGTSAVEASGAIPVGPEITDVPAGAPWLHAGLNEIPHEKLAELTTVKVGEGIWNPVHSQLAFAHPDWSPAELNAETHKLLIENKIINLDGTELRANPGAHVVVHPDGMITHDGGTYDFKAPTVEAPVAPTATSEFIVSTPGEFAGQADAVVRNYINNAFGNKGFFGFGATSPDNIEKITAWSDPEVGFAHHTIADIDNASNSPMPIDPHRDFGINNEALLERMKDSILQFANETGVRPYSGEKIGDYLQRAVTEDLMRGYGTKIK